MSTVQNKNKLTNPQKRFLAALESFPVGGHVLIVFRPNYITGQPHIRATSKVIYAMNNAGYIDLPRASFSFVTCTRLK
jgi:hypothetical protein